MSRINVTRYLHLKVCCTVDEDDVIVLFVFDVRLYRHGAAHERTSAPQATPLKPGHVKWIRGGTRRCMFCCDSFYTPTSMLVVCLGIANTTYRHGWDIQRPLFHFTLSLSLLLLFYAFFLFICSLHSIRLHIVVSFGFVWAEHTVLDYV